VLIKNIRDTKASWTPESHTYKLKWILFFILDCGQWRNWRGGRGARRPPWQAKCKKWAPLLACISVFSIMLIFSRFCFQRFSKISWCVFRWFRVWVQTSQVDRITNLPRFFVMCLTGICDYPYKTNIGKFTA